MAVRYSLSRPENRLYVQNARILAHTGLRVPKVFAHFPDLRVTVLEDVGDRLLHDRVQRCGPAEARRLYRRVLDAVARLHDHGRKNVPADARLAPPFSDRLYRWERSLFTTWFLRGVLHLPQSRIRHILRELGRVAGRLRREHSVLIHRDLQSTNIALHRGETVFLDFQGMRFGPASYDMASLLCDPYVSLPAADREFLLSDYACKRQLARETLLEGFRWAAVQRLIQALGAFGRLSASRETAGFARYVRPALQMLGRALGELDNMPALEETVADGLRSPVCRTAVL
jgi:aminoglycoside/choline kinase family phosphotransferase